MMIEVSRIETKRGIQFKVELMGDQGRTTGRECTKAFTSGRHYDEAARLLGVDTQEIIDAVANERAKPVPVESSPEPGDSLPFSVRPRQGSERKRYATIREALDSKPDPDSVIEWNDPDICCAVDFDWHGVEPPRDVTRFAFQVKPAPAFAWETRSGGLRLIYTGPYAQALGAAGVVSIYRTIQNYSGIELLTHTRYPVSEVIQLGGGSLADISSQFADEVEPSLVEDYLAENEYALGQRYPHDRCPIDPDHVSNAADPVFVTEHGIHCHSCHGRTGKGFRSFAFLMGVQVDSLLSRLVRGFVHWEHARLSLTELHSLPESILKSYYLACLLGKHGVDDPRIESVFLPHCIVRGSGIWLSLTGEARNPNYLRATIAGLPATQNRDGESITSITEKFLDNVSLASEGYEPVKLVHGSRIGTRWGSPDKRPRLVIPVEGNVPEYLSDEARLPEADAWEEVERAYPRIDRKLIEFLVACRGHVERGSVSMAPIIFLDGVSGSGKTSHLQLAAAFCGDRATDIIPTPNDDEMGRRLWEAFQKGSFISVNEAAKGAAKAKVDQTTFLNFVLHISPTATYKVLYRGYAPLGGCPIVSITDIEFDSVVMSDGQLGRRSWYKSLGTEALDWRASTSAYGLSYWTDIRKEIADACGLRRAVDSLVSIWTDRYFLDSIQTLDDVAESLGISCLNQSGPATERLSLMKQLFEAWRSYPGPESVSARNRQCKGFKAFRPSDYESGGLAAVWASLHDTGDPFQWRRASELSWQRATGWEKPLRIEFKPLQTDRRDYLQMRFQQQESGNWVDLLG